MTAPASDDRLVKHGVFLLLMSQVANVSNMAFHMVMGRYLSPDEYSILATMLNMMLVLSTPLDALRSAMAHSAGRATQAGDRATVRALAHTWFLRTLYVGVPVGFLLVLASHQVAALFHMTSPLSVQVAGCLLPILLVIPVLGGILQGAQAFVWMSLSMHGWGVIRLLLGFGLVALVSATATSGVVSHAVAQIAAFTAGWVGVLFITRGIVRASTSPQVGGYFLQALLMLAGYAVLMNSDVMLVRAYHPEGAGPFARAATIGRSVIFLPMPIALAMFPKVITMGSTSAQTRRTLGRAMLLAAGLIGCAVGAVWLWPWLPLRIIYNVKEPSADLLSLVRWVCLAMCPLGFTYVLVHFEMAQHRFAGVPWLLICAGAYVGGAVLWHDTILHIVTVLGLASLLSALLFAGLVLRSTPGAPPVAPE